MGYSVLTESTGFSPAVRQERTVTVRTVIASTIARAAKKTHALSGTASTKPRSQTETPYRASGAATRKLARTIRTKRRLNMRRTEADVAPQTLRMPISLRRCWVSNNTSPKTPISETKIASTENAETSTPARKSLR